MSPLLARILADFIVVVHAAYVLVVVLGVPAIFIGRWRSWNWVRNRWFRGIHLAMIVIVVAESWCGITCPLTTWETQLRRAAGQESYTGDFLANIVHELLFFDAPPWVFTLCYSLFGLLVLLTMIAVPPRWRRLENDAQHPRS